MRVSLKFVVTEVTHFGGKLGIFENNGSNFCNFFSFKAREVWFFANCSPWRGLSEPYSCFAESRMKSRNTRYFEISLSVTSNPTKIAVFVTKLIYCIYYSNISRRISQFLYVTARGRCSLYTVTYHFFAVSPKLLIVITSIRAYFLAQSLPCNLVGSSGLSLVSLCQYVCLFVRCPQCSLLDSAACYI